MDRLFRDFGKAVHAGDGTALAATLVPEAPLNDPSRLRNIWNGARSHDAKPSIKRKIQNSTDALNHSEVQGWTEVYYAYWKALGEIISLQNQGRNAEGKQVSQGCRCPSFVSVLFPNAHSASRPHGQTCTRPGRS